MKKKAHERDAMREAGAALLSGPATIGDALDAITSPPPAAPPAKAKKALAPPRKGALRVPPAPSRYLAAAPESAAETEYALRRHVTSTVRLAEEHWQALSEIAYHRYTSRKTAILDRSAIVRELLDHWIAEQKCALPADLDQPGPGPRPPVDWVTTTLVVERRHWAALTDAAWRLIDPRFSRRRRTNKSMILRAVLDEGLRDLRSEMREPRKASRR